MKPRRFVLFSGLAAGLVSAFFVCGSAHAATMTWMGPGTDLGTAANWSTTKPNVNGDTALWNGTVAGDLSLTYTGGLNGSSGNAGLLINLSSSQTGSLGITAASANPAMRISGITIASGAGVFSLGGGANALSITMGGVAGSTQTLQNDSSNTATINSNVTFNNGGGGSHTYAFAGAGNWLVNNNIGGSVSVRQLGTGITTLAGNNTYTNLTYAGGGTLALTGSATGGGVTLVGNSSSTAVLNLGSGANLKTSELTIGNNDTYNGISNALNGAANMTGGSVAATSWLIVGRQGGNGTLNQSGGTITNPSGATGYVAIGWGYGVSGATGVYNLSDNAVLNASASNYWSAYNGSISIDLADYTNGSGALNLSNNAQVNTSQGFVMANNATSSGTLSIGDHAALNIAASNGFWVGSGAGTINVSGGSLSIGSGGWMTLGQSSGCVATINQTGGIVTTPFINPAYASGATATYNLNGGTWGVGTINNGSGTFNLNFNGGTLLATGNLTLSNGNVQIGANGGTINNGGNSINISQSLATDGSTPGGGMAFQGSGTTALAGANTYTGATTVNGGLFLMNGNASGGGNYTVAANATLGGSGSITGGGTVTLSSSANLAPGNNATTGNVGTLTLPSLAINGGGTAYFDLSGTNATAGSGVNDLVSVSSALSLAGSTSVYVNVIDNAGIFATSGTSSYPLFSYGSLSGFTANSLKLANSGLLTGRQRAQFVNDTTNNQIDLDIIGVAGNLIWVGSNGASWDTSAATANWYNTNSNANNKFVNGDNVTFQGASDGTPVTSGSGMVTINGALEPAAINVSGGNYTFSGTGKITGTAPVLTVQSGAALTIANTNDYTGGTQIQGLITLGTNNALPVASTALLIGSGGTLDLAGYNQQIDGFAFSSNGLVTASSGNSTLTFSGGTNAAQFDGSLQDGGGTLGLTVSAGTLALTSVSNTYTGGTHLNGGILNFANGSLPTSSPNISFQGGTLQWASGNTQDVSAAIAPIPAGQAAILDNNGNNISLASSLSGSGGLTVTGSGTFTLLAQNMYSGATTINHGTLQVDSGGSTATLGTGNVIINTAGTLIFDRSDSYTVANNISGGGSLYQIGSGTLTLTGSNTGIGHVVVGPNSGDAAVMNIVPGSTLTTTGELWLSSAGGAQGVMNVSGGAVSVGSWLAVGRGGDGGVLNVSGGSLTVLSNNLTLASFTGNGGTANISGGTVNAVNSVYIGERGTGTMTVGGSGVVNAKSVVVGVNGSAQGTLNLQPGGLVRTASLSSGSGTAAFNFSGGTLQNAPFGGLSVNMPANLTGQSTVAVDAGQKATFQQAAALSGAGGLTKTGAGTMVLASSTIGYTGPTVISGGVLQVQAAVPQLAYNFSSGSAVNAGFNGSPVITTLVGEPVISATGGPASGLGVLSLDGSSYLDIKATSLPNLSGSSNYTIGMWINTTQAGASLLYKGDAGWGLNAEDFFLTGVSGNAWAGGSGSNLGGVQRSGGWVGGNTAVNTGAWQYVTIVRSGGRDTFYVNGVADAATATNMGNPEQGTQDIRIGFSGGGAVADGALMYTGSISGISVYGTALTPAQVLALMNSGVNSPEMYSSLSSASAVSITTSGAGLDLNGTPQTIASLSGVAGANVYLGGGTLTVCNTGSTTFAGNISDVGGAASGTGGFMVLNGSGTLTLSGTNTYTGVTTVENGTLVLTNAEAIADGNSLTVGDPGAFAAPIVPSVAAGSQPAAAVAAVPEPGTLALLLAGAALVGVRVWRKRK